MGCTIFPKLAASSMLDSSSSQDLQHTPRLDSSWTATCSTCKGQQLLDSYLQQLLHLDSSTCSTFLHARQLLHLDSSTCSTPPRQTAPALGQQHLQHTSTPDSNLQHSAAPAALPKDWTATTLLQHASTPPAAPPRHLAPTGQHGHHMDSICSTFPYLAAKHT